MKYCVLILDGASGLPVKELKGKTCLEAASTPNLDRLARAGRNGLASTVPAGMEPSSAAACTSILGFDPARYLIGRGAIEAAAMGIDLAEGQAAFRCNLVYVAGGIMRDYSCGHIPNEDSHRLVRDLQATLGDDEARFYPGVSYRHILALGGGTPALEAICTPPHDIPNLPIADFLPHGPGSDRLLDLMLRAEPVLAADPVNAWRVARGDVPATMIWLFWGGTKPKTLPAFGDEYGLRAAMTSAVDLLGGLAKLFGITRLQIPGVTDGPDNDYAAQGNGGRAALDDHDLVFIHVESPDEAAHAGDVGAKIEAIEAIDAHIVSRLLDHPDAIRILAMPDHPTPIVKRTHVRAPVPFVLHGPGVEADGICGFTEAEAASTGLFLDDGWKLMGLLTERE